MEEVRPQDQRAEERGHRWQRQREGSGELDGESHDLRPGDAALIPAGAAQRIENTGPGDLVFLCLCTPRFVPEGYRPLEETP